MCTELAKTVGLPSNTISRAPHSLLGGKACPRARRKDGMGQILCDRLQPLELMFCTWGHSPSSPAWGRGFSKGISRRCGGSRFLQVPPARHQNRIKEAPDPSESLRVLQDATDPRENEPSQVCARQQ